MFWYLLPFIGIAFLLSLFLKQIPLSDVAGLIARGEAIGGEEAEALEAAQRAGEAPAGGHSPGRGGKTQAAIGRDSTQSE